jgi:pteridine reductase
MRFGLKMALSGLQNGTQWASMNDVGNKTVLVTGAAKRLGRAIALRAADAGMNVVAHYFSSERDAESLAREVGAKGRDAWLVRADLSDPNAAETLMSVAVEKAGGIDALVNSASIFRKSTVLDFTIDELEEEIRVNAYSPLLLCRAFAAFGKSGSIVNLLDSRINSYDAAHTAYHLSKRMLYSLTRMLAIELAPGIRVNGVAPGLILPPPGEPLSYLEQHRDENPLRRHGSPEEIADAVQFLLENDFVTGQVIYVDGGRHLNSSVYD